MVLRTLKGAEEEWGPRVHHRLRVASGAVPEEAVTAHMDGCHTPAGAGEAAVAIVLAGAAAGTDTGVGAGRDTDWTDPDSSSAEAEEARSLAVAADSGARMPME